MKKSIRHPKKELVFPTGYSRKDLGMRLYNWLLSIGAKRMTQLTRQGLIVSGPTGVEDGLTLGEHTEWLEDVLRKELSSRGMLTEQNEPSPPGQYDHAWIAEKAAAAAVSNFQLDYVRFLESAAKGGRNSKTPVKFKPELLIGLEHLSKAQQAEKLGCSTATIAIMRRQLRDSQIKKQETAEDKWEAFLSVEDMEALIPE